MSNLWVFEEEDDGMVIKLDCIYFERKCWYSWLSVVKEVLKYMTECDVYIKVCFSRLYARIYNFHVDFGVSGTYNFFILCVLQIAGKDTFNQDDVCQMSTMPFLINLKLFCFTEQL